MELMILLCKTLFRAWFDVYDVKDKQKNQTHFFICLGLGVCVVVYNCYSCFGLMLHVKFNFGWEFYNEDNKSSHENSSQKSYLKQLHFVWKFKISKTEQMLNVGSFSAYQTSHDEWRVVFKIFM